MAIVCGGIDEYPQVERPGVLGDRARGAEMSIAP
jgi:hypothetical protein